MQRKFRPRKKVVAYFSDNSKPLDYKDVNTLKKFISERGKILPRRVTGACAKAQRQITKAVKRARQIGVLPYTMD